MNGRAAANHAARIVTISLMAPIRRSNAADGFAPRLALYYAAVFAVLGIQMPFFPVWLEAKGLESGAIGLVLAVPTAVRLVSVPLMTRAADRLAALRAMLIAASVAAALG